MMSRSTFVTTGVLAILLGIQMNFVDSFVLTPRATKFWQSRFKSSVFQTQPLDNLASGLPNLNGSDTRGYLPNADSNNTAFAQNPAYRAQQYGRQYAPQQYQQYSRSFARNNYPFNTPNYANRQSFLPGNNRSAFSGGAVPALPAGYSSAGPLNQVANIGQFGPAKTITPPRWISWASIFLGAVLFIYGAAMGRE